MLNLDIYLFLTLSIRKNIGQFCTVHYVHHKKAILKVICITKENDYKSNQYETLIKLNKIIIQFFLLSSIQLSFTKYENKHVFQHESLIITRLYGFYSLLFVCCFSENFLGQGFLNLVMSSSKYVAFCSLWPFCSTTMNIQQQHCTASLLKHY